MLSGAGLAFRPRWQRGFRHLASFSTVYFIQNCFPLGAAVTQQFVRGDVVTKRSIPSDVRQQQLRLAHFKALQLIYESEREGSAYANSVEEDSTTYLLVRNPIVS
jgi:hypothetical protein